ncbi:SDR family oxidoreductase [Ovoidimarina sediminis]|uniref:SDR family oxidoreductase n=1 Tax=Ovoidimarina sediminis TaxID=3079856 RepID=UPI0039776B1C
MKLKGQIAVVTGGAQGIGAAVVRRLTADGARVAIWDLDVALAEEVAAESGGRAFECDITDWEIVCRARDATKTAFGVPDILVNSAGLAGPNATVEAYDNRDWARIIEVNLTGTYHVNKAVLPGMREKGYGRIVNIASVAGKEGNPNAAAYSAAKAGVIALTKSIGKETAEHNISVNCITPAAARTAIFDQMSQEHIDYMLSKIPRGRFVEVDEIANMVAWLVSAENSFTTGAVFDLSGGRATY